MILTKDNLLRFVREKKYVTPTTIAETFETTTMIASAALSEIAKEKLIAITYLKTGTSPYYYDPRQKEALTEVAEKHLSGNDKAIYERIKQDQLLNHASLNVPERLAIEKIKDFVNLIEINHQGNELKFWAWYLRDVDETKKQILDVLNPKTKTESIPKQEPRKDENPVDKTDLKSYNSNSQNKEVDMPKKINPSPFEGMKVDDEESKSEAFIENYFKENYLKVENKNKDDKIIKYEAYLKINKLKIMFDCIYYAKKPTDSDILRFYSSSQKPKIVFTENAPKKLYKLAENLDNLEIVNI